MEKLNVYVGCALTHASKSYKKRIFLFKEQLRLIPWIYVLDFVTVNSVSTKPDPVQIYYNDIHECVGKAHAFIADVSLPSLGLGWELATAVEKHSILTIMCAKNSKLISNLVIGAPGKNTHLTLHNYEKTISELLPFFISELEVLAQKLQIQTK